MVTVVEADVHRVDINSGHSSGRRVQSSSNSPPLPLPPPALPQSVKTWHRCSSARHSRLVDLRDDDANGGAHIGRTSSNADTRSSAKAEAEIGAVRSRRVNSCDYHGCSATTSVPERLRQLQRARTSRAAPRGKPSVVLLPPPAPARPAFDKVPRYNDTGSFEEVDERMLMPEAFRSSPPASESGQRNATADVGMLSAGGRSFTSALQNVVGAQYRKLWDLRATLEQSEDLSDDGQSTSWVAWRQPDEMRASFYDRSTVSAPSLLPLPSDVRRQTYRHLAIQRRLRQPGAAALGEPSAASVDSIEAAETDGDASDTSRCDFTTTSFESSTTTTTTDNNTDAGGDGRAHLPSSVRSLPAVHAPRLDGECRESQVSEATEVDRAAASRRTATVTRPSSSLTFARRSFSDVGDTAERQATRVGFVATETTPTAAAQPAATSLRTAARKRRDFRNERLTMHRLALDHDDVQSSNDQPSGDSGDGAGLASPGGTTSTQAVDGDVSHASAARCRGPSSALRHFLSYQLRSRPTAAARSFHSRHTAGPRDYRYRSPTPRRNTHTGWSETTWGGKLHPSVKGG